MKKYLLVLFSISIFLTGCATKNSINSDYEFKAQPVIKSVGNIEVIIDPNVEMMNILGRLANLIPYKKSDVEISNYTNDVDEYFSKFKFCSAVNTLKNHNVCYQRVPEFGMYLNSEDSDFVHDINDPQFIVSNIRANQVGYYSKAFISQVKNFRIKSDFDSFFISHLDYYNSMVDNKIKILKDLEFDKWLKEFYNINNDNKVCLYLTDLSGNYGISYVNQSGEIEPHAVVLGYSNDYSFIYLLSHEFSHPYTQALVDELYSYLDVRDLFDALYKKNKSKYDSNGYPGGRWVLNETINQACANKFNEKCFPSNVLESYENWGINDKKMIYVPQISVFFDNYEKNLKKYTQLKDFAPELSELIKTLPKVE